MLVRSLTDQKNVIQYFNPPILPPLFLKMVNADETRPTGSIGSPNKKEDPEPEPASDGMALKIGLGAAGGVVVLGLLYIGNRMRMKRNKMNAAKVANK